MYVTALILGFTGSIHCVGMCSPLAMTVTNITSRAWLNRFLYNTGRIITYAFMGLAASSAEALIPIAQYQNKISCLLGIVLLIMGFAGFSGVTIPFITPLLVKFISLLKRIFSHYLKKRTTGSIIAMGIINGFLPCGLTFMALMFCLTLKGPCEGFTYMLLFGAGTLPAMIGLTALINPVVKKFRWSMQHVMTVLLLMSGCLLIARGVIHHPSLTHQNMHTPTVSEIVICR